MEDELERETFENAPHRISGRISNWFSSNGNVFQEIYLWDRDRGGKGIGMEGGGRLK